MNSSPVRYGVLFLLAVSMACDPTEAVSAPSEHPRLLFSKSDLSSLKAKTVDSSTGRMAESSAELFASMRRDADVRLKRGPRQYSQAPNNKTRFKNIAIEFEREAPIMAFVYLMTGERKYLEGAKDFLRAIASWKSWSWWDASDRTGTLDMGALTAGTALTYDLLYSDLSSDERNRIREALVKKGLVPLYQGVSKGDKWPFNVPADNSWFVAGAAPLGLGALAVLGEEREAETWLEAATAAMERVRSTSSIGSDGGYALGVTYGNRAFVHTVQFGDALARVTKKELDQEWIRAYPYFLLYSMLPNGQEHLNFNDHRGAARLDIPIMARAAARYRDDPVSGYAQWYLQKYGRLDRRRKKDVSVFVDYDSQIEPRSVDQLPRYRYFSKIGWVIYRTGWDPDDLFFAFKAQASKSAAIAHLHYDAGHFVLYKDGWLLTDPGYQLGAAFDEGEFGGNQALNVFTKGSYGHNTVIVDGFSQGAFASSISNVFGSDRLLSVTADLTAAYAEARSEKGKSSAGSKLLERFIREVLVLPSGYIVVLDRIDTSGGARRVEALFHDTRIDTTSKQVVQPKISVEGRSFRFTPGGSTTALVGDVLLPDDAVVESVRFQGNPRIGNYISVHPANKTQHLESVVLLYPAEAGRKPPKVTVSKSNVDFIGLEIEMTDGKDYVVFNKKGGPTEFGQLSTDAATGVVRQGRNGPELGWVQGGTSLVWEGRTLLRADAPVDMFSDGSKVVVEAGKPGAVSVFSRSTGGLVQLSVDKGRSELDLATVRKRTN